MVFCVIRRKPYHLFWIGEEDMKASFDVTLSPKDLYRFNMYQTYTGFQGWSSIALGILGFVMAGISFQNGKTSYTLLYIAVGFLFPGCTVVSGKGDPEDKQGACRHTAL